MALNREWHRLNRMPPLMTREQRIKRHAARVCGCREIPESIRADVGKLLKSCKR